MRDMSVIGQREPAGEDPCRLVESFWAVNHSAVSGSLNTKAMMKILNKWTRCPRFEGNER